MRLAPWDRLHGLTARTDEPGDTGTCDRIPRADVLEVADRYEISLEVPGLHAEDVDVTVEDERVTLAGRRASPSADAIQYHQLERGQGSFVRVFAFSGSIDATRITATARDGVVTVILPRSAIGGNRRVEIT